MILWQARGVDALLAGAIVMAMLPSPQRCSLISSARARKPGSVFCAYFSQMALTDSASIRA